MKPDSHTKNCFEIGDIRGFFWEPLMIMLVGAILGLGINYAQLINVFRGEGSHTAVYRTDTETQTPVAFPVARQTVAELIDTGAVAVDARPAEIFAQGHLPKARSLPLAELDSALESFLRDVARDSAIIVYCSGYGCPDSETVASRLMSSGFEDVMIYEGGFPEWKDSGLPVETGGNLE